MKLSLPKPESAVIGTEEEPAPPPPNGPVPMTPKMKALYDRGLFTRAVVCLSVDAGTRRMDPMNWGIVVGIHPESHFPLEVAWTSHYSNKFHIGDDLVVIYRGMTAEECRAYLYDQRH